MIFLDMAEITGCPGLKELYINCIHTQHIWAIRGPELKGSRIISQPSGVLRGLF